MSVKEEIVGNIAVLIVSGKLMGGNETKEVHEKVKSFGLEYDVVFRGNDVVGISPKGANVAMYERSYYRSGKPRYIKVNRFVPDKAIDW